ncbi:hypothetical protein PF005_g13372 [Phytophthora fragariae]|uniref:Uncharacterized protein n=1 Tax=Phytophthora fragariae TaxID=53985 RepID=A0A6A3XNA1_9STRA|nr:hypothetical protein PF003_g9049 [Phytophthora fragariae]KAE8935577.1 hypothetical protein PF009_g14479 [Phytophthora fragariae]KAE9003299.1 hypothetical protein PF011_g12953 [Phytophthora fragariae]KAE9104199.1 hypothetical protein PF007_g14136 [Phytophthora fragariae]KAE9105718.1 hypothetical protein PF010_g12896 [Phytophthora fragariae]
MASQAPSTPTGSLSTQQQVRAISTTAVSSPALSAQDAFAVSDDGNPAALLIADQYNELRGERAGSGLQQQASTTDGLKQLISSQFGAIQLKLRSLDKLVNG